MTQAKTSEEIYEIIHHHTFPYCGCKSIGIHTEEVTNFNQKLWLPADKSILTEDVEKIIDELQEKEKKKWGYWDNASNFTLRELKQKLKSLKRE